MVVRLPELTLVVVGSVEPELVRLAVDDTLAQIEPAEVMLFDRPMESYAEVASTLWYEVPGYVRSSHLLVLQWDSWVLDAERWNPRWLQLDYVGAPWGWHGDGLEVGNGGFSLRSTELARWIARNASRYPVRHPEDVALCRSYRRELELDGFRWASIDEATMFAFERTSPRSAFGFHGAWNWPSVLNADRLFQRLTAAGDHARGKSEWAELTNLLRTGSAPSSLPAIASR